MGLYGRPRGELAAILAGTTLGLVFFTAREVFSRNSYCRSRKHSAALPERSSRSSTNWKKSMSASDRTSSEVIRSKGRKKQKNELDPTCRPNWQNLFQEVEATRLTEDHFESGFDWLAYIRLRYHSGKSRRPSPSIDNRPVDGIGRLVRPGGKVASGYAAWGN